MSLRQIAKELGISPAYLSYMLNGKRPWRKDLYQRYIGVVNTIIFTVNKSVNNPHVTLVQMLPPGPLPIEHVRKIGRADPQFLSNLP